MWDRQCDICCVDCHFYGNRELSWFWRLPPCYTEGYYKEARSIELQHLLQRPRPSQLPTLPVRKIYCCPSTQIKEGGGKKKKKTLLEINVAAQRAFTKALWSIYIENTIKLSQGEKRKPHVHSVWSPRSPGTSIACLFSYALLWHQIVKKGREHDAISINTWTSGLLKTEKKSSAKKKLQQSHCFPKGRVQHLGNG